MTKVINLRNTRILGLLFSAILFSLVYLIFVVHTFAQTVTPSARRTAQQVKVCQVHEKNIKTRLNKLIQLVTTQETRFTAIASRVENRYTTKLAPKEKVVPNYTSLVADITAKKSAVDLSLTKAETDVAGFLCSSADPKSQLTTFRTDMQTVKSALKDYRKSIRNLIVAVATAAKEPLASPSATP